MNNEFVIITAETINDIVNLNSNKIYETVLNAYIALVEKRVVNPPSYFLRFPDKDKSRIIALPALITENPRMAGIKWISSNPDNIQIGLKRASAVIILNDYETGYPIACLEGSIISALRTVYSATLVSNLLVPNKIKKTLGIVGSGNISEQFINSLKEQDWNIEVIKLFDLNSKACVKLKEKIEKIYPKIKIELVKELKSLVIESELIFLATTASSPYILEKSWLNHNPIVLNISLRDISPDILIASNNIVDDIEHVLNANTSPDLTYRKYGHTDFINCIVSDLINGYNKFDSNKPIIFSPMGMGILDLSVSSYIYSKSKDLNSCIIIDNFFEAND